MRGHRWALFCVLITALAFGLVKASQAEEAAAPKPPSREQIHAWINDLSSDSFATRDAAQRNLTACRAAAIGPLVEIADKSPLETRSRAVGVLQELATDKDTSLAAKANEALGRLARSEHAPTANAAQAARRENDVAARQQQLEKEQADYEFRRRIRIPRVVAGAAAVRVAGARTYEMTNINGRRTIKAKSDAEEVEIADGKDVEITMSITRTVADGEKAKKKVTEKFTAKDAKELKEKHPEAYKTYEKYAGGGGAAAMAAVELRVEAARPIIRRKIPIAGGAPRATEPPDAPEINHVDVPAAVAPVPRN